MGFGTKFQLMTEILRAVFEGNREMESLLETMKSRPLVLGSEVISLVGLAKSFDFLSGEGNKLKLEQPGIQFMNYVESEPNQLPLADENQKILSDIKKLEGKGTATESLIETLVELGSKMITTSPDLESSNTMITVTLPPRKKIPVELRGSIMMNQDAERKVIDDCQEELILVSPYIEVNILQMLFHQSYVENAKITVITSDKDNLQKTYWVQKLKTIMSQHFKEGELFRLLDEQVIAHAKIWLSDKSVLITSANVSSNSQTNNFEMGLYTDNPLIVSNCKKIIDLIMPLCKKIG